MTLAAPFTGDAAEIARIEQRFAGFDWSERRGVALLYEYDENKHWQRTFLVDVGHPAAKPASCGTCRATSVTRTPAGRSTGCCRTASGSSARRAGAIFLRGEGASVDGDRPFLDRFDLESRKIRTAVPKRQDRARVLPGVHRPTDRAFLTWHESPTDPPNAMLRTLGKPVASPKPGEAEVASTARAVTHIPDPTPAVRAVKQRLVKYKRKDGTQLSFTLLTPPGYKEGTRIPAILYAYPLDYASASTAGQISGSEREFTRLSDYRLLLLSGYAIIDNAAFPIVGDPKKAYDTYLEQLVDDAQRGGRRPPSRPGSSIATGSASPATATAR